MAETKSGMAQFTPIQTKATSIVSDLTNHSKTLTGLLDQFKVHTKGAGATAIQTTGTPLADTLQRLARDHQAFVDAARSGVVGIEQNDHI